MYLHVPIHITAIKYRTLYVPDTALDYVKLYWHDTFCFTIKINRKSCSRYEAYVLCLFIKDNAKTDNTF